jgi:hypothetical protein
MLIDDASSLDAAYLPGGRVLEGHLRTISSSSVQDAPAAARQLSLGIDTGPAGEGRAVLEGGGALGSSSTDVGGRGDGGRTRTGDGDDGRSRAVVEARDTVVETWGRKLYE